MTPPRITVHYLALPQTRADRIFWLLEELGLEYAVRGHSRSKGGVPQSLRDITPLGKSPVVEIDGVVHTETGSIVHNLLSAHPTPGIEASPSAHSYFWALFSEGTMMLHLQPSRVLGMMAEAVSKRQPASAAGAQALTKLFNENWSNPNVQQQLDFVEEFISRNKHFSGNQLLGEGDFMMAYPLNLVTFGLRAGGFSVGPSTRRWLDEIKARPAWLRGSSRAAEEDRKVADIGKL